MKWSDFAEYGARISQWAADYHQTIRNRPVRAQTRPGDIYNALPITPPETPCSIDQILDDFDRDIMAGMTHWQHPRFFAYFPANAAPASVLAEYLTSSIAAQCMLWQTSPAATEMETRMLDWLRQAVGLPDGFSGVIQDSASGATLAAVLTMRERALNWQGNSGGLGDKGHLRIYCSGEVHSSIDRAIWIAGIGQDNLIKLPVKGARRSMDPDALRSAIKADLTAGLKPAGIIACVGGTGAGGTDDVAAVCAIAREFDLYVHVDAAWAGAAMICPEYRDLWAGVDEADSVVFNPHKWLGAQFDCSAHFLRDAGLLSKTLAIQPEYLKTKGADGIINYSELSIPLGRRFRALKLWFLIRAHGLTGLRDMIRNHVNWSNGLADRLRDVDGFKIVTEPMLSLFTFQFRDDATTERLLQAINDDGRIYLTQTRVDGAYVIRFQVGQFNAEAIDIETAYEAILEMSKNVSD